MRHHRVDHRLEVVVHLGQVVLDVRRDIDDLDLLVVDAVPGV